MAAPIGNKFWQLRSKHGRDKIFSSPEILWDAACEYFQWCDENPWLKIEQVKLPAKPVKDEEGNIAFPPNTVELPTQRPYTLSGLCIYLNVDMQTFENYCTKEEYKDFFGIAIRVKEIIRTQKFEGAAVGAFNANIIARDLGLRDNVSSEVTGKDGKPIETKTEFEITLKL